MELRSTRKIATLLTLGLALLAICAVALPIGSAIAEEEPNERCVPVGTCDNVYGSCNKCPNPPDYGMCCRRCDLGTLISAYCTPHPDAYCATQTFPTHVVERGLETVPSGDPG